MGGLLHGNAIIVDGRRQLRGCLVCPHLRQNLIGARVRLDVEVHGHGRRAVVGVKRIHVFHAVHATHLLLDGSGDRLLDGQRVGAHVRGQNLNLRVGDVGELRRPAAPTPTTAPTMTMMTAITIDTIGRSIKNLYMAPA